MNEWMHSDSLMKLAVKKNSNASNGHKSLLPCKTFLPVNLSYSPEQIITSHRETHGHLSVFTDLKSKHWIHCHIAAILLIS